jgi:predicted RNA-binding protein YlqC (UPF0109 family)
VADSTLSPDNMHAVSEMQLLITEITRALVDDVDAVKVEVITENDSILLRLHVAPSDIGKVIGKQGRTARSLRTILGAASMKLHHRFSLDIIEAGRDPQSTSRPRYNDSDD